MDKLFKKVIYTGAGLVSFTASKLQSTINELIERGQLTEDEGKKVIDDLVTDTENARDDFEDRLSKLVNKLVKTFDTPKRGEVDDLKARIADLEQQLADSSKAQPKKVVVVTDETEA